MVEQEEGSLGHVYDVVRRLGIQLAGVGSGRLFQRNKWFVRPNHQLSCPHRIVGCLV